MVINSVLLRFTSGRYFDGSWARELGCAPAPNPTSFLHVDERVRGLLEGRAPSRPCCHRAHDQRRKAASPSVSGAPMMPRSDLVARA